MNTNLTALLLLALSTASATQASGVCRSSLPVTDVISAMGEDIRVQPVFAGGGIRGWRLYGLSRAAQLKAQGIQEGALVTHICGEPAKQIFARGNSACCDTDTSDKIEVTFKIGDGEQKVLIARSRS